tara:strand:- start:4001 stop:6037 length:2037 start_codon:yes stop_codon:yes gene_type:complete
MAKGPTITTIASGYYSRTALNTNFTSIDTAFDNTLSLDGSAPNAMAADLDLGTNDLLNVGTINGASATGLSAGLTTVAGISADISTVSGISADVTTVAGVSAEVAASPANAAAAATSASNAATSETNASNSASASASSATDSANSAAAAASALDSFDDRYLGSKAVEPTLDNDGDALVAGALYFNSAANEMRVYDGANWIAATSAGSASLILYEYTATSSQTTFSGADDNAATMSYTAGNIQVVMNGVILDPSDFTATSGTSVVLAVGAATSDILNVYAFKSFTVADTVSASAGGTFNANVTVVGTLAATALTGDGSALTGIPPAHSPVAVSGTTPSLNVGSYNFFDNGTLTGDTTLTFASVPTDAKWQYKFKPVTLTGSWDVSTAYPLRSVSILAQESLVTGLFFKPDGLKMYITGTTGDDVNEYNLSTAWNVSTAVFLHSFYVGSEENLPDDVFFKPDGTKMYIVGFTGDDVNEYNLGTAWDVSTAVFLQLFSVAAQETYPGGISFKPDGTKMYITGRAGDDVNEYNLSTAWNVTTAVFLQAFSVATQELDANGIFFKPDGLKMYTSGYPSNEINEYNLSTAWDVSTAVHLQAFATTQLARLNGVFFKPDGLSMYAVDPTTESVYEFSVGSPTSLTLPASLQNAPALTLVNDTDVLYEFVTDDAGVTVTLISEEVI